MIPDTYDVSVTLASRDCDLCGTWRPSAVLEAMQETACAHWDRLACGRADLLEHGIVWIIVRTELSMHRCARLGETVSISTFFTKQHLCLFPRFFILTGENGEEIGKASSFWVMMDLEKRRMIDPSGSGIRMPDGSGTIPPMRYPSAAKVISGAAVESSYTPVWSDLDINGHVNNARYADWLCNSLGTETMRSHYISSMVLNYDLECLPDDRLAFSLARADSRFSLRGTRGAKTVFTVSGDLTPRK
ncbi:MAG: thioesterase [Clostridia bacterium]|nr:thioesterase [Clostridia bacterium]